jgi:hypothetical protein
MSSRSLISLPPQYGQLGTGMRSPRAAGTTHRFATAKPCRAVVCTPSARGFALDGASCPTPRVVVPAGRAAYGHTCGLPERASNAPSSPRRARAGLLLPLASASRRCGEHNESAQPSMLRTSLAEPPGSTQPLAVLAVIYRKLSARGPFFTVAFLCLESFRGFIASSECAMLAHDLGYGANGATGMRGLEHRRTGAVGGDRNRPRKHVEWAYPSVREIKVLL